MTEEVSGRVEPLAMVRAVSLLISRWRLQDPVLSARHAARHTFVDSGTTHISPARFEHINPYGTYNLNVEAILQRIQHRPLKPATTH